MIIPTTIHLQRALTYMVGLVVLVICVHDGGGGDHVVDVDCDVTEQTGGDL